MLYRSRVLLLALLSIAAPAFAQSKNPDRLAPAKIVFVCEHGAAKSVIAAAQFNKLAAERGLNYRAIARGVNPDPEFAAKAVTGMKAESLAVPAGKPTLVQDADVADAAKVVTLGCQLPTKKTAVTDWSDIPSVSEDYSAASKVIRGHVEALVDSLATQEKQTK